MKLECVFWLWLFLFDVLFWNLDRIGGNGIGMNENTVREVWNELTPFDSLRERSFKFPVSESEYCRFVHFLEKKKADFFNLLRRKHLWTRDCFGQWYYPTLKPLRNCTQSFISPKDWVNLKKKSASILVSVYFFLTIN